MTSTNGSTITNAYYIYSY